MPPCRLGSTSWLSNCTTDGAKDGHSRWSGAATVGGPRSRCSQLLAATGHHTHGTQHTHQHGTVRVAAQQPPLQKASPGDMQFLPPSQPFPRVHKNYAAPCMLIGVRRTVSRHQPHKAASIHVHMCTNTYPSSSRRAGRTRGVSGWAGRAGRPAAAAPRPACGSAAPSAQPVGTNSTASPAGAHASTHTHIHTCCCHTGRDRILANPLTSHQHPPGPCKRALPAALLSREPHSLASFLTPRGTVFSSKQSAQQAVKQ